MPSRPSFPRQLANLAMATDDLSFLGKPAIQHLLRGLELARASKDGYWIARCANAAARHAAATGRPDMLPRQARELMAEAAAAKAACRKVLPEAWVKSLEASGATREAKKCIDKHLARGSPQAWVPSIVSAHEGALTPAPLARGGSVCAGCGQEGIGLRSCSACHQDRYCRCAAGGLAVAGVQAPVGGLVCKHAALTNPSSCSPTPHSISSASAR